MMYMKLAIHVMAVAVLFLTACKKDNTPENLQEGPLMGTKLAMGSFVSNAHTTTGMVKVIDSMGVRYLAFDNFKTDNAPALRVWLSKNTGVADYISLGDLKAVNGNFYYPLTAAQSTTAYNHVLIWCETFSVLFGHAVLQ
jgi:Electron transfer DM13